MVQMQTSYNPRTRAATTATSKPEVAAVQDAPAPGDYGHFEAKPVPGLDDFMAEWLRRYQLAQQPAAPAPRPMLGAATHVGGAPMLRSGGYGAPSAPASEGGPSVLDNARQAAALAQARAVSEGPPLTIQGTGFNMTPGYGIDPRTLNGAQRPTYLPNAATATQQQYSNPYGSYQGAFGPGATGYGA